MTSKYPAWVFISALLVVSCTSSPAVPASAPESPPPTRTALPPPTAGLSQAIGATVTAARRWHLVPDGLATTPATAQFTTRFESDPIAGTPVARLRPTGREFALSSTGNGLHQVAIPLAGLPPALYAVDIVEHLSGGREAVVATTEFRLSAPEYVVWTLDFEGDEAADTEMANTAAIADGLKVPMVVMWNPRVWNTSAVRPSRAEAMLAWTKERAAKGDEVALHLHGWLDWIAAAGVTPRTTPTWAGRRDGYDVPLSAYSESETKTLLDTAVRQMIEHGLPRPTSFRAGGNIASSANLRALVDAGFTVDCTAVPAGSFGTLRRPWTLPADAQPYRPSGDDPSAPGNLALLESPMIGGNTYAYTVGTIQQIVRADLAMLAPAGTIATERRTLNIVSHPGTIVPAERAAIESLLHAFDPLRYDTDNGPLRFVTLQQLVTAYAR